MILMIIKFFYHFLGVILALFLTAELMISADKPSYPPQANKAQQSAINIQRVIQRDLNLFINALPALLKQEKRLAVVIKNHQEKQLTIAGSFQLKRHFLPWLNFECELQLQQPLIIKTCNIKQIKLPLFFIQRWIEPPIQKIWQRFKPFHPKAETASLFYYKALLKQPKGWHKKDLMTALLPIFKALEQRQKNHDIVLETRALLSVLGSWAAGKGLSLFVPDYQKYGRLPPFYIKLLKRHDFAKHFLISAAVSASSSPWIAKQLGLYKELQDKKVGRGFSFRDLTADMAGSQFGYQITKNKANAQKILKKLLKMSPKTVQLMPKVDDLPAKLSDQDFLKQYQHTESKAYKAVIDKIKKRVEQMF